MSNICTSLLKYQEARGREWDMCNTSTDLKMVYKFLLKGNGTHLFPSGNKALENSYSKLKDKVLKGKSSTMILKKLKH